MTPLFLVHFCKWLELTPLSQFIQTEEWIVPTVQTIHILSIALVMSSVLMINLRLLGLVGRDLPQPAVARRFLPVIWWTLPILLMTGTILIIGEPARSLLNPAFQLKMVLLLGAIAVTLLYRRQLARNPLYWDGKGLRRVQARSVVLASSLLWIGIVFAGRWIAYLMVD
jgi:hypothetical protein